MTVGDDTTWADISTLTMRLGRDRKCLPEWARSFLTRQGRPGHGAKGDTMHQFSMDELQQVLRGSEIINQKQRDIRSLLSMAMRAERNLPPEKRKQSLVVQVPIDYESVSDWWLIYDRQHDTVRIDTVTGLQLQERVMVVDEVGRYDNLPLWLVDPVWQAMCKFMSELAYKNVTLMTDLAFFQAAAPRLPMTT